LGCQSLSHFNHTFAPGFSFPLSIYRKFFFFAVRKITNLLSGKSLKIVWQGISGQIEEHLVLETFFQVPLTTEQQGSKSSGLSAHRRSVRSNSP
ncbi:MAG: hypothetical protein ACK40X_10040, partial [Armatimonadota bacterium]